MGVPKFVVPSPKFGPPFGLLMIPPNGFGGGSQSLSQSRFIGCGCCGSVLTTFCETGGVASPLAEPMGSGAWRVGGAVGLSGGVETIEGSALVAISSSEELLSSLGRLEELLIVP